MSEDSDLNTSETPTGSSEQAGADAEPQGAKPGIKTVRERMPDAPVSEDALLPVSYDLDPETGMVLVAVSEREAPAPLVEVVLVARVLRLATGVTLLELAVLINGSWRQMIVSAEAAASKHELVRALASQGVTVDDANARGCLEFLRKYRRVNANCIPVARVSNRTGWLSLSPPRAFALGQHVAGPGSDQVAVRPADDGAAQILGHFARGGSEQSWRDLCCRIPDDAEAWVALYAGVLPMLLRLLGRETVILVEASGDTSTGKTILLIWIASMFGAPGGNGRQGLIMGWLQTPVALERRAMLTPDIPVILDEVTAESAPRLEAVLYQFATGQGKSRGSLAGLQATDSYSGVIFSSGETSLASCTRKGGIRARLITLSNPPFGANQPDLVREIQRVCQANYGHAALRLANHLACLSDDDLQQLHVRLGELETLFRQSTSDRISGRVADSMALIALAGELFHRVCNLAGDPVHRTLAFWQRTVPQYAEEIPLGRRALEFIMSWHSMNRSKFQAEATTASSPGARYGLWGLIEADPEGSWLVVPRETLDNALGAAGFRSRTVMTELKRSGLLKVEADKLTVRRQLPGGERLACYVVSLNDGNEFDPPPPNAHDLHHRSNDENSFTV